MLSTAPFALLFLGCGAVEPQPDPTPTATVEASPKAEHWELIGRVTPGTSPWPDAPPFEGGKAMIAKCKERRPCAAERWRSTSGDIMDLLLLERTIHFEDGRSAWPARWMSITGVLRSCMGDPLTVPPTDDPEAVRTLETSEDSATWLIHLSGQNSCGLVGLLKLDAKSDDIDLRGLRCESKKWSEGGKQCALTHKKASLSPEKVSK